MPHTFAVDNVAIEAKALPTESNIQQVWAALSKTTNASNIQQTNTFSTPLIAQKQQGDMTHHFVRAVHFAYANHYPLSLSPDHVWTLLVQQLAFHVNANAEKLRKQFVQHEGKKELLLMIPSNPNWASVVDGFSALIKPHIGEQTHATLVSNFSTTTPTERICSEIVMMDALRNYFSYKCMTCCGIPSITLEGTPEDWEEIRQRAAGFAKYDMQNWLQYLLPILDEFVQASYGKPNVAFWQKMYKVSGGSGGPYLSGWITDMFAYLDQDMPNTHLGHYNGGKKMFGTPFHPNSFAGSINKCPAKWDNLGQMIDFKFCAGFVGVSQNVQQNMTVRPELGWAVIFD